MKLYLIILFMGLTLTVYAQASFPVYFFNEKSVQSVSQKIQGEKGLLVSLRDGIYYSYKNISENRNSLANYLDMDSFMYVDLDRKISTDLATVECNYLLSKRFEKRLALLELIIPAGKKNGISTLDVMEKTRSTMGILKGHANYFIVLVKGHSVGKVKEIIPLLIKEPLINNVVVMLQPGDYLDSEPKVAALSSGSDELIRVDVQ